MIAPSPPLGIKDQGHHPCSSYQYMLRVAYAMMLWTAGHTPIIRVLAWVTAFWRDKADHKASYGIWRRLHSKYPMNMYSASGSRPFKNQYTTRPMLRSGSNRSSGVDTSGPS